MLVGLPMVARVEMPLRLTLIVFSSTTAQFVLGAVVAVKAAMAALVAQVAKAVFRELDGAATPHITHTQAETVGRITTKVVSTFTFTGTDK